MQEQCWMASHTILSLLFATRLRSDVGDDVGIKVILIMIIIVDYNNVFKRELVLYAT